MALSDVNFQEGEGQDFILEIPNNTHTGFLNDFLLEDSGSQYFVNEISSSSSEVSGDIFIMSE